ncbi:MAG: hypothetical protein IT204_24695 [Fimbriimonadaceae bacterium]|nr:hypothetical protein [Fimbriimonadaceae bacterium]
MQPLRRRWGQTLPEYALLLCLLAVAAIAILAVLGRKNRDTYTSTNDSLVTTNADVKSGKGGGGGGGDGPAPVGGHW